VRAAGRIRRARRGGAWSDAITRALAARSSEPAPAAGGEAIAAERVIAMARGRL
jgi:hypothetical protein